MTGRLPPRYLDDLRQRVDLADLIGRDVVLKRKGREYVGLSPFTTEKTPSFTVVPAKGFWHCFSSGEHGDCIGWLTGYHQMRFMDAVAELARLAGLELPSGDLTGGELAGGDAPEAAAEVAADRKRDRAAREVEREELALRKRRRGYDIWTSRTGGISGTLAETYLVEARGIPADLLTGCEALGFRPDMPLSEMVDGRYQEIWRGPALLAAMQMPTGRFAACHVTWLATDGSGKLELFEAPGLRRKVKKVFGLPSGAAIRLGPPSPEMCGGEGIETTLSGTALTGLPGWAAYSLDNIAGAGLGEGDFYPDRRKNKAGKWMRLPTTIPDMTRPGFLPPRLCRKFTLLGDGDTKDVQALERKLIRACRRFIALGMQADYVMSSAGQDFNDVWRAVAADGRVAA